MSTRANIDVTDGHDELVFYRHSDGYPEGTLPTLHQFLGLVKSGKIRNNVSQASGWLILIGSHEYGVTYGPVGIEHGDGSCCDSPGMRWKVGAYEPTTCIHGDIEYLYVVDLHAMKLRHKRIRSESNCNAIVPSRFYFGRFNRAPGGQHNG